METIKNIVATVDGLWLSGSKSCSLDGGGQVCAKEWCVCVNNKFCKYKMVCLCAFEPSGSILGGLKKRLCKRKGRQRA